MEGGIGFNLDRQLWEWTAQVKKVPEITEADSEELKCHLLDSAERWERAGLDQEEAFWVASRRLRLSFDVVEDYHTVNNRFFQMEKTVLVLAGTLGFFLSYYFFACSAMLVFYGLTIFGVSGDTAMQWISHYLYGAQFMLIAVSAVIFFMDRRFSRFFHQVRLKPRHALLLLFITFLFALGRQYLYEEIRTIGYAQRIWGQLYDVFFYFRFSFPFLFCLSLIFLYWRYGRKLSFLPRKNGERELQRGENEADWSARIDRWCNRSEWNSAGRFSSRQELKGRMLQLMAELEAMGLAGGEAFGIAVKRLDSGHFKWEEDSREADDQAIEIKKSLLIMAGVPIYFLLYYFLGATSKLLFIILRLADWEPQLSLVWVSGYLKITCFICIVFFMSLYFFEKRTISFIENLEIKNKTIFFIFLAAIVFGVLDTCFLPICKNLMEPNAPVRTYFYQIFRNFDHVFPLIACFSFIVLYLRYYRKTRI
ncbi:MAG: hypothetical protein AAGU19_10375 [Prolixibacteraceae bacterium]